MQSAYPVKHLSYSSIYAYLNCGYNWKLKYIDKIDAPSSPALVFGGVFHEAVEHYLRAKVKGESEDLRELWHEAWLQKMDDPKLDVEWGDKGVDFYRDDGERILSSPDVVARIDSVRPQITTDGEAALETRVSMWIDDVPVPIIGYVDLIEEDGIPGDFKTSSAMWSKGKPANEIQPIIYLDALHKGEVIDPSEYRFRHYVFTKAKKPRAEVFETTRSPGEIRWMHDMVRDVWQSMQAGIYVTNPLSWKCNSRNCEYWDACRGKAIRGL
ncbi:MAG: PD-(D/E)XK nuclease family protein [Chloroflexota bacterium]